MSIEWIDFGTGSQFAPPSQRLRGDGLFGYTIAVSPILVAADPDWRSKPGSLEWQTSAELFNANVGWMVHAWHWSVVRSGDVVGSGNEPTAELARKAAIDATRASLGRRAAAVFA